MEIRKFLFKTAMYVILVAGGFELLYRMGFIPVVTDSSFYDYKMSWIQRHPLKQPELVVVGSSVPLYGVESSQLVEHFPLSYFNFCSWNVKMTECQEIVRSIVREYRPRYVVVGSSLGDFCGQTDSSYLHYTHAPAFIRRHLPEMFYSLDFRSIHMIVYRKKKVGNIKFDQWGGGDWLFDRAKLKGQVVLDPRFYTDELPFDPQNQAIHYQALDSMSRWLRDQHITMVFVQFPILGSSMKNDSIRAMVVRHIQTCQSIVGKGGGQFLNYCDSVRGQDTLFSGPIHLRPPGAKVVTRMLVRDLEKIIGQSK